MLATAAAAPLLFACSSDSGTETSTSPSAASDSLSASPLVGTEWVATSIDGKDVVGTTPPTALFSSEGTVSGTDGCNSYHGTYVDKGETLEIGPLASTLMACDPEVDSQSAAFMAVMNGSAPYSLEGQSLTIGSSDGQVEFATS